MNPSVEGEAEWEILTGGLPVPGTPWGEDLRGNFSIAVTSALDPERQAETSLPNLVIWRCPSDC